MLKPKRKRKFFGLTPLFFNIFAAISYFFLTFMLKKRKSLKSWTPFLWNIFNISKRAKLENAQKRTKTRKIAKNLAKTRETFEMLKVMLKKRKGLAAAAPYFSTFWGEKMLC